MSNHKITKLFYALGLRMRANANSETIVNLHTAKKNYDSSDNIITIIHYLIIIVLIVIKQRLPLVLLPLPPMLQYQQMPLLLNQIPRILLVLSSSNIMMKKNITHTVMKPTCQEIPSSSISENIHFTELKCAGIKKQKAIAISKGVRMHIMPKNSERSLTL